MLIEPKELYSQRNSSEDPAQLSRRYKLNLKTIHKQLAYLPTDTYKRDPNNIVNNKAAAVIMTSQFQGDRYCRAPPSNMILL